MTLLPLQLALGFVIGLSLGLLGGGGSILTVPALVYLLGQSPQVAVTTSLAIVGANSAMGSSFHHRQGTLNWKVAALFGGVGMITAYLAGGLSRLFTPAMLMVAFAVLMVVIGALMVFSRRQDEAREQAHTHWLVVAGAGLVVGLLTGVLGVGGGFLIVPALVMLVGLSMHEAVGTSLVIIAANSVAGLLGHLSSGGLDLTVTLVFAAAGLAGTFLGARLANRVPVQQLRRLFGIFVIVLGVFLMADNLPKLWM
jgi:uncharacterized protein